MDCCGLWCCIRSQNTFFLLLTDAVWLQHGQQHLKSRIWFEQQDPPSRTDSIFVLIRRRSTILRANMPDTSPAATTAAATVHHSTCTSIMRLRSCSQPLWTAFCCGQSRYLSRSEVHLSKMQGHLKNLCCATVVLYLLLLMCRHASTSTLLHSENAVETYRCLNHVSPTCGHPFTWGTYSHRLQFLFLSRVWTPFSHRSALVSTPHC